MPRATIDDTFLCTVSNALYEKFNIDHPTIQIERGDVQYACRQSAKKAAFEKQAGKAGC